MTATPSLVPAEISYFMLSLYVKFHYGGWDSQGDTEGIGDPPRFLVGERSLPIFSQARATTAKALPLRWAQGRAGVSVKRLCSSLLQGNVGERRQEMCSEEVAAERDGSTQVRSSRACSSFSSPRLLPGSQHREETAAGSGCLRLQQLLWAGTASLGSPTWHGLSPHPQPGSLVIAAGRGPEHPAPAGPAPSRAWTGQAQRSPPASAGLGFSENSSVCRERSRPPVSWELLQPGEQSKSSAIWCIGLSCDCPRLRVLRPGQPLCAERDTEAVNHGPLSASVHKQLIGKCFISALLRNRTTLLQPPALSSLTLHPSVFQPRIPHHLTQNRCISSLCSHLRAVRELTASWSLLAFTSRELQHPERAPSRCRAWIYSSVVRWEGEHLVCSSESY